MPDLRYAAALIAEHAHRNHQQHEETDHLLVFSAQAERLNFSSDTCFHG
jgi:hypothetical protein